MSSFACEVSKFSNKSLKGIVEKTIMEGHVGKTSLQILLLYMTTFSTIFNKISIKLGLV